MSVQAWSRQPSAQQMPQPVVPQMRLPQHPNEQVAARPPQMMISGGPGPLVPRTSESMTNLSARPMQQEYRANTPVGVHPAHAAALQQQCMPVAVMPRSPSAVITRRDVNQSPPPTAVMRSTVQKGPLSSVAYAQPLNSGRHSVGAEVKAGEESQLVNHSVSLTRISYGGETTVDKVPRGSEPAMSRRAAGEVVLVPVPRQGEVPLQSPVSQTRSHASIEVAAPMQSPNGSLRVSWRDAPAPMQFPVQSQPSHQISQACTESAAPAQSPIPKSSPHASFESAAPLLSPATSASRHGSTEIAVALQSPTASGSLQGHIESVAPAQNHTEAEVAAGPNLLQDSPEPLPEKSPANSPVSTIVPETEQSRSQFELASTQLQEKEEENERLREQIEEASALSAEKTAERLRLVTKLQQMQSNVAQQESERAKLQFEVDKVMEASGANDSEHALLLQELSNVRANQDSRSAEHSKVVQEISRIRSNSNELEAESRRLRGEVDRVEASNAQMDAEVARWQERLEAANRAQAQKVAESARLQEMHARHSQNAKQSPSHPEEMHARHSQNAKQSPSHPEDKDSDAPTPKTSRADKENVERHRRASDNSNQSDIVNEQKRLLSELERRLQRETIAASIPTPAEFIKIAKKADVDGTMQENARLRMETANLRAQLQELKWHHDLLEKNLAATGREAVAREMQARPQPLQEQAAAK